MRERSRLLRERINDPAWLAALEDQMATFGVAVAAARRDVITRLAQAAARGIGPFPGAVLAMEGMVDQWIADGPALAAEDAMRQELLRTRNYDGGAVGPHRSDLAARHAVKDMPAALCSTGEQKALLIAITLANARLLAAERGATPLLLLDEVAAHLDQTRREALFAEVLGMGGQAWLTGTDCGVFAPLGVAAQHFCVQDGRVRETGPPFSVSISPDTEKSL